MFGGQLNYAPTKFTRARKLRYDLHWADQYSERDGMHSSLVAEI